MARQRPLADGPRPVHGIDTHREDTHPGMVLDNIAKQTGLELTTEKRTVRVLMADHADIKKGESKEK